MGSAKGLLEINGQPLVVRTVHLLVPLCAPVTIVGTPERYQHLGFAVIADELPEIGPLGGILTALARSPVPWNLVVACDLPYLSAEWLRYLVGWAARSSARVVLPESDAGLEPLCAVYHRDAAATIRAAIERGVLKVTRALEGLPVEVVAPAQVRPFDPRGVLFQNLNTPEEYKKARAELEGR
jgi:molybdopterin-guanine dinucleotide biosynthesis protein A